MTQEGRALLSGDGNSDAEVLRRWLDHLAQFISSLDEIEGDDDPFDFIENAMEAYQGGVSPDTAPSPTSPAMLIIVESMRTLAQAMNSATGDFYETPDARDRVTRAVAQQSLARALNGVRQEGESWLAEVMPTAEQVRQRIALTGAAFTAALDAGAQQMAEMDEEDAEAEADPYGAMLLHSDPSRSDAPILEKVCSFTEAEHKRYADAHRALEKMLEGDLYLHVSDECARLCDVLAGIVLDLHSRRLSLTNTGSMDERRRQMRSALISFTNALQIHEEQTIKRAEETFGRYAAQTRKIRKLFSDLKKTSFDYRWLRVQGDVLQHVDINGFKYSINDSLDGPPEVIVEVDRQALLEYTNRSWNQPWMKRKELQDMDSDPSVQTMIQNIQPLMNEMHTEITKLLFPNVARDVAIVKELIGRFEGRRGMYAMSTGPGFTRRRRTLQFSPLATHVLAFADNYEAS
ncbi:hypothetical protein KXD97_15870 [Mycobacterium sp. SMC-8]|uniref:hypothetical protein n=1 Tax=Mycobacterium sp. SMC-8 TaxID=2857060 RepID=UPI0021B2B774|nr:hypothetical protein [Mycobacterium sp. SMC-8]UXA15090.1 hypothetical protein KXD97_15870 [Mycobacterium sp. SMC-8]